ncbi:uncharacterized protein LOC106150912 isoform X1 [Lingula anatina]|uniref:Uncharacterized protein LOC106150912 isoform X1 n=2 Tax=Lingula anatina TaxID=7574 RepID=A0A1S3H0D0_LINAN|nr:uncharacterized protein LOC106150912 isoform X1 [Lingula anatina]|eukprot:XP_013379392.1 uncharacterized protein LOC106150912 isoform X1 [Lingula anatina]
MLCSYLKQLTTRKITMRHFLLAVILSALLISEVTETFAGADDRFRGLSSFYPVQSNRGYYNRYSKYKYRYNRPKTRCRGANEVCALNSNTPSSRCCDGFNCRCFFWFSNYCRCSVKLFVK